jgi:DNA-binding LacI/PurR family transcriptional regulator
MIKDPTMDPPKVILPTELIVRESCGARVLAQRA